MIKVTLGGFARSAVESYFGGDLAAGVRAALVHYARKLKVGRRPLGPPPFLPGLGPSGCALPLDLTIDAEDEAVFQEQARSSGTTVDRLALHAVLVYLAELEFLGVPPREGGGGQVAG